jgi:hypothetical protein
MLSLTHWVEICIALHFSTNRKNAMSKAESEMFDRIEDYLTPKEIEQKTCGRITEAQVSYHLRYRQENGLDQATVRMGRKLAVNFPVYQRWYLNKKSVRTGYA